MIATDDEILNKLVLAQSYIAHPMCWCSGNDATDAHGMRTGALDANAARWCAAGAFSKAKQTYRSDGGDAYLLRAASMWLGNSRELSPFDLALVNDNRGHQAVIEVYDISCCLRLNDLDLLEGGDPCAKPASDLTPVPS